MANATALNDAISANGTQHFRLAYTYDPVRVHELTSTSDGRPFTYDGNGNTQTDGQRTMTWDVNNQVTSIVMGSTTTSFAYDGAGTRVTETSGGNTLAYVGKLFECLNPSQPAGATTPSCTQWTRYIYAGSMRIAQVVSGGAPTCYEGDHLGSTRVLSGARGAASYQPFGLATSDSTSVRYKFTGQEWDAETGLYNYNGRFGVSMLNTLRALLVVALVGCSSAKGAHVSQGGGV